MSDPINSPSHYTSDPSGVECIQITEHRNFCVGNAIKYLWRAGLKDSSPQVEDLKKARWYIDREIERVERETKAPVKAPSESISVEFRDCPKCNMAKFTETVEGYRIECECGKRALGETPEDTAKNWNAITPLN